MNLRRCRGPVVLSFVTMFFVVTALPAATTIAANTPAESITRARIQQLPATQRSAWLKYLDRSDRQRQADKDAFRAEMKRAGVTEPIDPPHGFAGRGMPLDREVSWYAGAEARRVADIVVSFQTPAGGWGKNLDLSKAPRQPGERFGPNNVSKFLSADDYDVPKEPEWNYIGTIDNDATIAQIRFLAKVTAAVGAKNSTVYRAAFLRGIHYLLEAQYPNGGWPQVWPLEGGYHDAITINDDAMLHATEILHDVATGAADYKFLPPALVRQAWPAAERGIDCLLKLQIVENGVKTAWAQQYDALTLEPTSARNYEMAALTSDESFPIAEFFLTLPNPAPAEVAAVHAACAWFAKVEIFGYRFGSGNFFADRRSPEGRKLVAAAGAGPIWARYYQIGTDTPIFGDRDKTIHDDVNELSLERRNGYSWYNAEGITVLNEYKSWAQAHPR